MAINIIKYIQLKNKLSKTFKTSSINLLISLQQSSFFKATMKNSSYSYNLKLNENFLVC